jgi:hypothetical protein
MDPIPPHRSPGEGKASENGCPVLATTLLAHGEGNPCIPRVLRNKINFSGEGESLQTVKCCWEKQGLKKTRSGEEADVFDERGLRGKSL